MSKRFRDSSEHQNEAAPEPERRSPGRQTLSGVLLRSVRGDRGGPSGAGGGVPDALRWTGPRDADAPVVDAGALAGGVPLPSDLAARLGGALGTEVGGVRLHTGGESQAAASAFGARAFALGQDVHFGAGEFAPGTRAGDHLIAHEVAHTVQQRGAAPSPQGKLTVSAPGDAHEVEADRFADGFLAGTPTPVRTGAALGIARLPGAGRRNSDLHPEGEEFPRSPLEKENPRVDFDIDVTPGRRGGPERSKKRVVTGDIVVFKAKVRDLRNAKDRLDFDIDRSGSDKAFTPRWEGDSVSATIVVDSQLPQGGVATAKLRLVQREADPPREWTHEFKYEVVADLETLKQSIVAARRMVRSKWAAADSWFKLSCMNHSAAHKRFTSALEAAGQPNLLEEVVLGLLIAYISGAAGGAAAGAMKKGVDKLKNEVLKGAFTDANKDFVKALVKLGAGALVKEPKKGGVLNDPFRYYLEISAVLTDEREVLDSALDAMEDRATKAGPSDVITELPDQILERALPDSFIEQAKEPVQSETQYLTSMWKTWLRTYGYTLARVSNVNNNVGPRPSYRYEVRDNVSGKFRDVIRSQAESCGQNPDTWFAEANIAKEAAQKQLSDLAKPSEE